jgi:hypothetical protein
MHVGTPVTHFRNSFISADVMTSVLKILNGLEACSWAAESAGTSSQNGIPFKIHETFLSFVEHVPFYRKFVYVPSVPRTSSANCFGRGW